MCRMQTSEQSRKAYEGLAANVTQCMAEEALCNGQCAYQVPQHVVLLSALTAPEQPVGPRAPAGVRMAANMVATVGTCSSSFPISGQAHHQLSIDDTTGGLQMMLK